jgi:carboxypeptidase PM20D1
LARKTFAILIGVIALLAAALLSNTYRKGSSQIPAQPVAPIDVDAHAAAQHLAGAIRFRTVSFEDQSNASVDEFRKLQKYLEETYPRVHATLKREVVGDLSLLYMWPGTDPAAEPIMLMAHQDVVPIAPGTEKDWQADPFAGTIRDGFVWGRGAWDDKGNLIALLEAAELLVRQGFKPRRTLYFAFGHDEELGGAAGAKRIAEVLKARGVRLSFVMDEGLVITDGVLSGLDKPAALVGTAEKGFLTLALSTDIPGGHSSMPAAQSAIGTLSLALSKLEHDPMPAALRGVAAQTLETLAPEMHGLNRVLLSNLWLFEPLVVRQFEKSASTNAMVRTTTSLTVFQAGNKANVIPGRAEALVNFRLLPGDSADSVIAHVKRAIGNDAVKVQRVEAFAEASRISTPDSDAYRQVARAIREAFPDTLVAPGLMLGATDSRHMAELSDQILRFSPIRAKPEDLPRFHGTNERLSIENLGQMIAFYHRLLRNVAGPAKQP